MKNLMIRRAKRSRRVKVTTGKRINLFQTIKEIIVAMLSVIATMAAVTLMLYICGFLARVFLPVVPVVIAVMLYKFFKSQKA